MIGCLTTYVELDGLAPQDISVAEVRGQIYAIAGVWRRDLSRLRTRCPHPSNGRHRYE
jgi:hypothetical protein